MKAETSSTVEPFPLTPSGKRRPALDSPRIASTDALRLEARRRVRGSNSWSQGDPVFSDRASTSSSGGCLVAVTVATSPSSGVWFRRRGHRDRAARSLQNAPRFASVHTPMLEDTSNEL